MAAAPTPPKLDAESAHCDGSISESSRQALKALNPRTIPARKTNLKSYCNCDHGSERAHAPTFLAACVRGCPPFLRGKTVKSDDCNDGDCRLSPFIIVPPTENLYFVSLAAPWIHSRAACWPPSRVCRGAISDWTGELCDSITDIEPTPASLLVLFLHRGWGTGGLQVEIQPACRGKMQNPDTATAKSASYLSLRHVGTL
eukprot:2040583-Rhodomonas_salina.4